MNMAVGEFGRGAHGEADDGLSELGEAPERAEQRGGSPAAGDEDDKEGDDAGPPARRGWMERMREVRRCSWIRRGGEGSMEAASTAYGGDELHSGREGERAEEGEEVGRE